MRWFANRKIRSKILLSFAIVAIFMGILGYIGVSNITKISNLDSELYRLIQSQLAS